MHRTLLPRIPIILLLAAVLAAFGQSKASGEVDPSKCWTSAAGDAFPEVLSTASGGLITGFEGAKIEAVSIDGKKAWSSDLGGEIRSNVLITDAGVFVVTSSAPSGAGKPLDLSLRMLSGETGITGRTLKLPAAEHYSLLAFNGSLIVVSNSGTVQSLDIRDGSVKWRREIAEGFAVAPVLNEGKLAVASTSEQVFVISLANGEIESMRKVPARVTSLSAAADGGLIVGDDRGNVSLLTKGSEKAYWKFKSGGAVTQAFEADGEVLAVSNDNFVYLLNDRNGGVLWKKRLGGRVAAAAVYDNKYVVVAGIEEHSAMLIDISNGKVAAQIKLADDETVTSLQTTPSAVLVLTNGGLTSYSLNGCGQR